MPQLPFGEHFSERSGPETMINRIKIIVRDKVEVLNGLSQQSLQWYQSQPWYKKAALQVLAVIGAIAGVLVLVFHKYIVHTLVKLSDDWKDLQFGSVLLFFMVFFVGFPPLLGFSLLSMLTGMIYGFKFGWPLLASASISGSFASFLVFRYFLKNQAVRLINHNEKFRAFSEILKEDSSLFLLILLRLCPLPYSLSNGGLAAIPELSAQTFLLASVITSPKLMIHVFVGKKIKELGDDTTTSSTKIIDLISIIVTAIAASLTTYIIYNKMQQKLKSYHINEGVTNTENYDRLIFGNFEDDLESGTNVELSSTDFDADNFIIEDDEDDSHTPAPSIDKSIPESTESHGNSIKSKGLKGAKRPDNEVALDDELEDLDISKISNSTTNRNY